eukprot:CAMPEP_0171543446 /NCGR_PEP_ID=MMETSP0960-20121227/2934_1 /TAXON_ID=87120 /ORGANISM="Aurantiochytrium limacinum, Strain ATCCMYA-1381" /LENGTH=48 /DNA_ID= /DNA_START= /DNA_END= /DNA_ORIENTATION=
MQAPSEMSRDELGGSTNDHAIKKDGETLHKDDDLNDTRSDAVLRQALV